MIEVVLDGNDNDKFLEKVRPVYKINIKNASTLADYREQARRLIKQYASEPIVIVYDQIAAFSINLFAVALFIEAYQLPNNIECIVFKVKDTAAAVAAYKPFVALTIGLKYVMRLFGEDVKSIYKQISGLGYLGLEIKEDYIRNCLKIKLPGTSPVNHMQTETVAGALEIIGTMKALSLMRVGASIEAEIFIAEEKGTLNEDDIIHQVVADVLPWIK